MKPLQWMGKQLSAAEQAIIRQASERQDASLRRGTYRLYQNPERLADQIGMTRNLDPAAVSKLRQDLQGDRRMRLMEATLQSSANPGVMARINQGIAENPYVRRGLLPTAVGGGVFGLTEAGVQLAQLTGLMQDANAQQQRTDNSELMA